MTATQKRQLAQEAMSAGHNRLGYAILTSAHMRAAEWREFGLDMIDAGRWAEFHQKRGNWTMFDWWNSKYQIMIRFSRLLPRYRA